MFSGFTDQDFEAYAPNKWKSNVFNRERLEVKQKLLELARDVSGRLAGADGSPLTCEASVEHPALWNHKQVEAQHLFFSRNEGARKEIDRFIDRSRPMLSMLDDPSPQRNHLYLAVTIDHQHLEIALRLHPDARVDRQNLERKLGEPWERESFLDLLHSLPPVYQLGVTGGTQRSVAEMDDGALRAAVTELGRPETPGKPHWLVIRRAMNRDEAKVAGGQLVDSVRRSLEELLPVYQFVAWSRENDYVSMREVFKQEKQTRLQKGLVRNDRVRVVRGVFSGRTGVIQEIDAKGALKVLLGTVAIKVAADEVEKA